MARIRNISNFYEKLHAIERADSPEEEPSKFPLRSEVRATMPHIADDDPRLLEIRWLLGVVSTKSSGDRRIQRDRIDFERIRIEIEVRGLKRHEVAAMLSRAPSTVDYKMRHGAFTDAELEIFERNFNLKQGALIKHG